MYAIKGRVSGKPIAICVAETGDVATYAEVTVSPEVLRELLPGPVTLVFKRTPMLNPELNPSSETIGIRIPDDRFIRALTTACGTSLALTSANLSGHCSSIQVISSAPALPRFSPFFDSSAPSLPAHCFQPIASSPTSSAPPLVPRSFYEKVTDGRVRRVNVLQVEDFREIWDDLGAVVDAGCRGASRLGSTVVDLSVPTTFTVVRAGDSAADTIACLRRHGLTERQS